jgi:hypothetical protein
MQPGDFKKMHEIGLRGNALVSFAHFCHSERAACSAVDIVKSIKRNGHRVFLDSGAFTNMSRPGTVKLDQYCEFLKSEQKYFDEVCMLDDIVSRKGTLKNYAAMRDRGFNPLFVDHLRKRDTNHIEPIYRQCQKLCLSAWGTDPTTHNRNRQQKSTLKPGEGNDNVNVDLPAVLKQKVDLARRHKTKLHLLAVGSLSKFLPFLDQVESVDSAVVGRCVGYGKVLALSTKEIGGIAIPILQQVAHPGAISDGVRGGPTMSKELVAEFRQFIKGKSFSSRNMALRAFCFRQILRYVDALNELDTHDIKRAFDKAQEKASTSTSVFSLPDIEFHDWLALDQTAEAVGKSGEDGDTKSDRGSKQSQTIVQSVILNKERFETRADADRWIKEHDFEAEHRGKGPDETENSWRYRQRDPGDFSRLRTIRLDEGVQAVIGPLKQAREKRDEEQGVRLIPVDKKAPDDRRIVFGVVLEPDSVDSQGDTIKSEEIERAAHLWLARFQDRGLMHRKIINGKIEIYESYIAPRDLIINGQKVKKGTWLLMLHVLDDVLWKSIQDGDMTGFSMGGFARRVRT